MPTDQPGPSMDPRLSSLLNTALPLGDLLDTDDLSLRLCRRGLRDTTARKKASTFSQLARILVKQGISVDLSASAIHVPGRVELLGKHTDYAGGRSLLVALEQGICLVAIPRSGRTVHVVDAKHEDHANFELNSDLTPRAGHWSNYLMTVARRLVRNFAVLHHGAHIAFMSDLPAAAGMSSSSALITAALVAFTQINNLADREAFQTNIHNLEAFAEYAGTVENGAAYGTLEGDTGVGTFGGSEDHTAILACQSQIISQYRFCPVRLERTIPMPRGYVLAIAVSGVCAEKTGAAREKYNRASRLASAAIDAWREATGNHDANLAAAISRSGNPAERFRAILSRTRTQGFAPHELLNRFEHFLSEDQVIIPGAVEALWLDDLPSFGRWIDRSQKGAETLLGNQVPETIYLARQARNRGAVAASAFGAGFGGSVWAMVEATLSLSFLKKWASDYRDAFPRPASRAVFLTSNAATGTLTVPKT